MKRILILVSSLLLAIASNAQDSIKAEKPVEIKLSGFIMNNMFFDTRKNVEALDGMVLLFPSPIDTSNARGEDLNAVKNVNLLSFASRLRAGITGPDAFGSKTSGLIEFDFTGRSNTAAVRFRQAWIKMNWKSTELLVGRAWHPMASLDVIPSVMALSIGAPFQPFNRSAQITLTQKFGKLNAMFSVIYQNDYTNYGPSGKSYLYQTNALIPNLHGQLKYKSDNAIAGIGVDYKALKPRTVITSPVNGERSEADELVHCPAFWPMHRLNQGNLPLAEKQFTLQTSAKAL
ncbi:MAG: hypothetical protein HC906_18115 [Bacteroidales bacterium]|nr:hypothetical protein [Bacteroidales bacterium]